MAADLARVARVGRGRAGDSDDVPVGVWGRNTQTDTEKQSMTTYFTIAIARDLAGAAWVCSCLCLAVGVMFIMWWWMDRNDKLQGG